MPQHPAVHHQMIATATEMLLISDSCLPAVKAELRYYCDDPFAVQMVMSIDQSPAVSWTFGRELLINGTTMPSGIGDVQVFPTHDGLIIELRSGSTVAAAAGAHARHRGRSPTAPVGRPAGHRDGPLRPGPRARCAAGARHVRSLTVDTDPAVPGRTAGRRRGSHHRKNVTRLRHGQPVPRGGHRAHRGVGRPVIGSAQAATDG